MTDCFANDSAGGDEETVGSVLASGKPMPLSLGGNVAIAQALSVILWMGNSD